VVRVSFGEAGVTWGSGRWVQTPRPLFLARLDEFAFVAGFLDPFFGSLFQEECFLPATVEPNSADMRLTDEPTR